MAQRPIVRASCLLSTGLLLSAVALARPAPPPAPGDPWPRGERPGWNGEALEELFSFAAENRSTGVVIVHRGELVAERYWPAPQDGALPQMLHEVTGDGRTLEDVASLQKGVVSLLVGRAVQEGVLDLDRTVTSVLGEGWSRAEPGREAAITVRHLLTMTSGLLPSLVSEAEPGTRWRYNTRAYSVLCAVLERVTHLEISRLTEAWLTGPLGMAESSWQRRDWVGDRDANALGFVSSARDLARLGWSVLSGGVDAAGNPLTDAGYLAAALQPSLDLNPAYGYLWWLNGVPALRPGGAGEEPAPFRSLAAPAPSDMVAAFGALGRRIYVVPSLELVVTRLGDQPPVDDFDERIWARLMAVLPEDPLCRLCDDALAGRPAQARAADGAFIHWREHVIDDPTHGVADLSGSDGLAMADLDGDGRDDIVSVHESDTVYDGRPVGHVRIAWAGDGPDDWHSTSLAAGSEAAAAEDVALADLDGDGDIDVVVACELAHLIVFENPSRRPDGGPGADPRTTTWRRAIPELTRDRGSWIRVFLADLDGDGRPEVVAPNKGEQNPDPAVASEPLAISFFTLPGDPLEGDGWREHELGRVVVPINSEPFDLDGDGDLDVVAGSRGEARVLWFENRGDLDFLEHRIDLAGAPEGLAVTGFNLDAADLDGDGRTDIVTTSWPGTILLLHQPESLDAPWRTTVIGSAPPDQLVSVRLADIDDDGDLDAFVGGYSRGARDRDGPLVGVNDPLGRIVWFENPGPGEEGEGAAASVDGWTRHDIARPKRGMYDKWLLRDLDGDGDLDAVGTRGNSAPYDGVIWLEQVRRGEPGPVFEPARAIDSQQMGPAEG